nr:hypothetical protein [Pandoravirus belohorizontensis]
MNVIYALVGAAPQFFCDALGRAPSCEAGVRRAFVVGFCGCALLALWTANRYRGGSTPPRKPDGGAHRALGTVQDDVDDPIAPRTVHDGETKASADPSQRHWTESMSKDSESSTDTQGSDIDDDDDDEGMHDCRASSKTHEDQFMPAPREADTMSEAYIDAKENALLLGEEESDGDDNEGTAVCRCHGLKATVITRSLPPDSSGEIQENAGYDRGGGRRALCEHDVSGRPDDSIVQEMPHDGGALAVTDGILARWSAQGLSVHASWAPAYADTHP